MINDLVKENERIDDLQNGYYIIQDPRKFCFGMDAVLLSGFARVKKGEKVLEDRKSTRLNSSHRSLSRMPSSA